MADPAVEPLYALKGASQTRDAAYGELREKSEALSGRAGLLQDVAYGPHPRQRLDVFTQQGGAPIFVFVHGGYWRALAKDIFLAQAAPFADRGFVAVNVEYALRPEATVPQIVEQVLDAIAFVAGHAADYGGRADRMVLCGHSAGGHMVAWAAATDWAARGVAGLEIAAVVPVSGVFDLAPLRETSINDDLQLDAATAESLSPLHYLARPMPPTLALVGGAETLGFQAQTQAYAAALRNSGHNVESFVADGLDHFTICQALADPESETFARVAAFVDAHVKA